ncbi:MAG: hypothetical protein GKR99_02135 [Rhodobacteraceae bacterium]|nr:hypothetical protein [Paracoccaceae bacterium]
MRNAALVLGIIGGVLALIVGFFSYGYTVAVESHEVVRDFVDQVENVEKTRAVALFAPILAIAGAAMSKVRALWGGAAMLIAAGLLVWGLGWGFFITFPVALIGTAGLLAIAAGRPDEPKAHF